MTLTQNAYVQGISFTQYGTQSSGSGSISVAGGESHTSFTLKEDEVDQLRQVAFKIFEARRQSMIDAIKSINVSNQLTYEDKRGAIDAEVVDDIDLNADIATSRNDDDEIPY